MEIPAQTPQVSHPVVKQSARLASPDWGMNTHVIVISSPCQSCSTLFISCHALLMRFPHFPSVHWPVLCDPCCAMQHSNNDQMLVSILMSITQVLCSSESACLVDQGAWIQVLWPPANHPAQRAQAPPQAPHQEVHRQALPVPAQAQPSPHGGPCLLQNR